MGKKLAEIERPHEEGDWREWLVFELFGEDQKYVSVGVDYLKPGETERGHWCDSGIIIDVANIDAFVAALRAAQLAATVPTQPHPSETSPCSCGRVECFWCQLSPPQSP